MSKSSNILCFLSSKGGSGKTVTSASLGTFLSQLGFKVLLIDTDAATNGMTLLFLEQLLRGTKLAKSERGLGLFEARNGSRPTVIQITDNLSFLPAAFHIKDTDRVDPDQIKITLDVVLDNSGVFDVVLLDAQAGADEFARLATAVSDVHVIVSEYDPISAQGIDRLKLIFSEELAPASTYTLFNKILPEFADALGEGMAVARWLPPIPWDVEVVRAFTRRDLAINMEAPNPYTLAIAQVALGCLGDLTGTTIEQWQGQALSKTMDPIERRLLTLEAARGELANADRRDKFKSWLIESSIFVTAALGVGSLFSRIFSVFDNPWSVASIVLLAAGVGAVILTRWRFLNKKSSAAAMEVIDGEIAQLKASLDAAKSALTPGDVGVWQALRRKSRPVVR